MLAERQLAGGRDLQPHLVLDVGDVNAVALADLAGLEVEEVLRHEEQRQTLGAGPCALGAGQHQVEDVLEQVAGVTRGDESLHTVDVPRAVVLLDRLGAACADVGTRVGLGQHHGGAPAPLGGDNGPLLLLFGGQLVEDAGEACATAVHPHRRVRAEQMLVQRPQERLGHRHSAELLFDADLVPAAVDDGLHRLLERARAASPRASWGRRSAGCDRRRRTIRRPVPRPAERSRPASRGRCRRPGRRIHPHRAPCRGRTLRTG